MERAIYQTPLGAYVIGCERGEVVCIKRVGDTIETIEDMGERGAATDEVYRQLVDYMEGRRRDFTLALSSCSGTPFQRAVWQALREIPYGETRSYGEIAAAIGNPKASRAVGMANNRNPIAIVTPCHRVIGSSGKMVGYAGGVDTKIALLRLEQTHKL